MQLKLTPKTTAGITLMVLTSLILTGCFSDKKKEDTVTVATGSQVVQKETMAVNEARMDTLFKSLSNDQVMSAQFKITVGANTENLICDLRDDALFVGTIESIEHWGIASESIFIDCMTTADNSSAIEALLNNETEVDGGIEQAYVYGSGIKMTSIVQENEHQFTRSISFENADFIYKYEESTDSAE